MTTTESKPFSIEGAMSHLGMSRQLIYTEIKAGRLKTYRVGRRRYVSAPAISQYIADRERETQAQEQQEVARA